MKYKIGDEIKHKKYGYGIVYSIDDCSYDDVRYWVAFSRFNTDHAALVGDANRFDKRSNFIKEKDLILVSPYQRGQLVDVSNDGVTWEKKVKFICYNPRSDRPYATEPYFTEDSYCTWCYCRCTWCYCRPHEWEEIDD